MTDTGLEFSRYLAETPIEGVDEMGIPWVRWPGYDELVGWTRTSSSSSGADHLHVEKAEWAIGAAQASVAHHCRLRLRDADGELCSVPMNVGLGTLMLAHRWYLRPQSPHGLTGSSETGGQLAQPIGDSDVLALLGPYRAFGLA